MDYVVNFGKEEKKVLEMALLSLKTIAISEKEKEITQRILKRLENTTCNVLCLDRETLAEQFEQDTPEDDIRVFESVSDKELRDIALNAQHQLIFTGSFESSVKFAWAEIFS